MNSQLTTKTFRFLVHIFFIIVCALVVIPIITLVSVSISDQNTIFTSGYSIIPKKISFSAYGYLAKNGEQIIDAYKTTGLITLLGTVGYLLLAAPCAYALSNKKYPLRSVTTFYLFFTMLFSGGMVPSYILITQYLGLKNTLWVLFLPSLGNVWYLFLMRTFFQQLPEELKEAATIDGAGPLRIFLQIVIPLSKPVIATVTLFMALQFWNSWFECLLYITDTKLYTLQYLLQKMLREAQDLLQLIAQGLVNVKASDLPSDSMRMAMCICAIGPSLLIFPFFQKYFVKGLTVGSVKG